MNEFKQDVTTAKTNTDENSLLELSKKSFEIKANMSITLLKRSLYKYLYE